MCIEGCTWKLISQRDRLSRNHLLPLSPKFTLQCLLCNNHWTLNFPLFTVNMVLGFVSRGHHRKVSLLVPVAMFCFVLLLLQRPSACLCEASVVLCSIHITQSMSPLETLQSWLGPTGHLCDPLDTDTALESAVGPKLLCAHLQPWLTCTLEACFLLTWRLWTSCGPAAQQTSQSSGRLLSHLL